MVCYRCGQKYQNGGCGCADGICVVHGNNADYIDELTSLKLGAVISDPPYGINYVHGIQKTKNGSRFGGVKIIGDDQPFDPRPFLSLAPKIILWGANNYAQHLPQSSGWIVWDKRCNSGTNDQSDAEMAWTNCQNVLRVWYQIWNGFSRQGRENGTPRWHPSEKSVEIMQFCIQYSKSTGVICDPFSGGGTTLIAAKLLGRIAIGIEIVEEYVEATCKRLRQEVLPGLAVVEEKQLSLMGE